MAYKIAVVAEARIEVIEAVEYYRQFSAELGNDLLLKFYETLETISESPALFEANRKGYRKSNLEKFPYKIIFKIKENTVTVVAFAHHKRRPEYWKK